MVSVGFVIFLQRPSLIFDSSLWYEGCEFEATQHLNDLLSLISTFSEKIGLKCVFRSFFNQHSTHFQLLITPMMPATR